MLKPHLLTMPFANYVISVADVLARLGYRQITVVKPMPRQGKGRNRHGGYDIQAYLSETGRSDLVLVQVKQVERPISRASVDELRGAMLRLGAVQGVLVTTSSFSRSAVEAVQAGQHAALVRLVDGKELTTLLHSNVTKAAPYFAPDLSHSLPQHKRVVIPRRPAAGAGDRRNVERAKTPPNNLQPAKNGSEMDPEGCSVCFSLDIAFPPTIRPRLKLLR